MKEGRFGKPVPADVCENRKPLSAPDPQVTQKGGEIAGVGIRKIPRPYSRRKWMSQMR